MSGGVSSKPLSVVKELTKAAERGETAVDSGWGGWSGGWRGLRSSVEQVVLILIDGLSSDMCGLNDRLVKGLAEKVEQVVDV